MPELTVDAAEAGLRLDAFLARRGLFASTAASRRFLAEPAARVRVDGRPARKGERLAAGQRVEVPEPPPVAAAGPGSTIEADPSLALEVLYADEALVAVAKPAGLPSHPLRPGERGTVASALVARFPECAQASPDPREGGLVHRLDTGTSGVLVAARQRALWTPLHEALGGGGEKTYLAEVAGACTATVVDAPIGRVGRRGDHVRVGDRPGPAAGAHGDHRGRPRGARRPWCRRGYTAAAPTRSAPTWPMSASPSWAIPSTETRPRASWPCEWGRKACGCTRRA